MDLINCPECGGYVLTSEKNCSRCGTEIGESVLKGQIELRERREQLELKKRREGNFDENDPELKIVVTEKPETYNERPASNKSNFMTLNDRGETSEVEQGQSALASLLYIFGAIFLISGLVGFVVLISNASTTIQTGVYRTEAVTNIYAVAGAIGALIVGFYNCVLSFAVAELLNRVRAIKQSYNG